MNAENILTGLIAGLLSSLFGLLIASYWNRAIVPWIEDRVYKGTRIDGLWINEIEKNGEKSKESARLEQRGNRIKGTITYPEDREGVSHTYDVEGEFCDRTLCLIQKEIGHGYHDIGAILLDFKPGGSYPIMKGKGIWQNEGEIEILDYTWKKK